MRPERDRLGKRAGRDEPIDMAPRQAREMQYFFERDETFHGTLLFQEIKYSPTVTRILGYLIGRRKAAVEALVISIVDAGAEIAIVEARCGILCN